MGNKDPKERSLSNPYYSATPGGEPGKELTPEQEKLFYNDNQPLVDNANNQYRHDNPLLSIVDDTAQATKKLLYVAIGISGAYLILEAIKVYKE